MNSILSSELLRGGATRAIASGLLFSSLFTSPATAQQAMPAPTPADQNSLTPDQGLADIVVTARRVSENIQRVPVAVTAVDSASIERNSITRIEDLPRLTPGFTTQQSFANDTPIYSIRGQSGDQNATANTEPAVQVYFADLNQSRSIGTGGSFFDLESVQVLKGPQGTLFGRNSTGGAILVTPRAPQHELGAYGRVSLGNYNLHDFEGALNLPIGESVALRIGGKISRRDGYIHNLTTGDDAGELNSESARASLLIEPSSALKSTFIGTYYHSNTDGNLLRLDSISPTFYQAAFGAPPPIGFGSAGAGAIIATLGADAAGQRALSPYQTRAGSYVFARDKVYSVQNNSELKLGDNFTIKNVIGYRNAKQDQNSDFAGSALPELFNTRVISNSKLFTEELQLQGEFGRFSFVVGGYYLSENVKLDASTSIFAPILTILPIPGLEYAFPARDLASNNYETRSSSIFSHGDYKFTQKLSISAGIRLTHDVKRAVIRYFDASGNPAGIAGYSCVLSGGMFATPQFGSCQTPARLSSTEPTYDVSLNYQATGDVLVYLAHRHGYRSGGFDIIPGNLSRLSFQPEKVDDVELGLKSKFDVGGIPVRLNAAAYHQWYHNIQRLISVPSPTGATANATINAAEAKVYGGELELTVRPVRPLELSVTYAYIHNRYSDFHIPYTPVGASSAIALDISDSHFAGVPQHQWSVGGRYSVPVPERYGDVSLSANFYGQSSSPANEINTANCGPDGFYLPCLAHGIKIPGRSLLDLRLDWNNIAGKGVDLGLFVTNVADRSYKATVLALPGVLGFTSVGYGPPRMFGAVLRVALGSEAR